DQHDRRRKRSLSAAPGWLPRQTGGVSRTPRAVLNLQEDRARYGRAALAGKPGENTTPSRTLPHTACRAAAGTASGYAGVPVYQQRGDAHAPDGRQTQPDPARALIVQSQ